MSELFSDTQVNHVDQLVGPGKKYATVEDLAKSYAHADQTIAQRNDELARLREELESRLAAEELFKKLNNPPAAAEANGSNPPVAEPDLAQRIRDELKKTQAEQTAEANEAAVTDRLTREFGTLEKAAEMVKAKASEMGVGVQFLQELAMKSPVAFYNAIGLSGAPSQNAPAPTTGNINTAALQNTQQQGAKPGTWSYYENIRKTDPKLYFTPKIQNQLYADARSAKEKGENFGI